MPLNRLMGIGNDYKQIENKLRVRAKDGHKRWHIPKLSSLQQ